MLAYNEYQAFLQDSVLYHNGSTSYNDLGRHLLFRPEGRPGGRVAAVLTATAIATALAIGETWVANDRHPKGNQTTNAMIAGPGIVSTAGIVYTLREFGKFNGFKPKSIGGEGCWAGSLVVAKLRLMLIMIRGAPRAILSCLTGPDFEAAVGQISAASDASLGPSAFDDVASTPSSFGMEGICDQV